MSVQNASMAIPKYAIDKIVAAFPITDFSSDAISGVSTYTFPLGIFSLDNGTTWNDAADYTLVGGMTISPSTWANLTVKSDGTLVRNKSGAATLIWKVALLAIPNTTVIVPPTPLGNLLYSSKYSYMKIALEGSYSQSTTSHVTTTIAHNLGYVPFFQAFVLDTYYSADARWRRFHSIFGNAGSLSEGARADATNIYLTPTSFSPAQSVTVYYRVYYDN